MSLKYKTKFENSEPYLESGEGKLYDVFLYLRLNKFSEEDAKKVLRYGDDATCLKEKNIKFSNILVECHVKRYEYNEALSYFIKKGDDFDKMIERFENFAKESKGWKIWEDINKI